MKWGLIVGRQAARGAPVIPPFVVIAFELTILFGGIATLIGMVTLGRLPRFRPIAAYDPRFTNDRFGVAVHCAARARPPPCARSCAAPGAEEVGGRMKYVFILVLLLVGAVAGGLMGGVVACRWVDNMTQTPRDHARRARLPDAAPAWCRAGGTLIIPQGAARARGQDAEPGQGHASPRWRSARSAT